MTSRYAQCLSEAMTTKPSYSETVARKSFRRRCHDASVVAVLACRSLAHRSLVCGAWLLVAMFALGGCGGGASSHGVAPSGSVVAASADPVSEPNAVVAQVGGHAITKTMFEHALVAAVKYAQPLYPGETAAPVPPDFAACVQHLQAASASSGSSGSVPSVAELKSKCEQQYQTLETRALDHLIVQQWVIGGGAEEGVHVSNRELEQALKKARGGKSQAQAEQELATSGRTVADFALETKVQLLGEGIRTVLARKTDHITRAQVVNYYNEHRSLFGVPKRRDLEIARAGSQAEALKIKGELASGKTFASVVSKLPSSYQPIYSKEGLVLGYEPGLYREPPLDHAIFAAKPNVLSGPVGISLGYYVFEVKRTYPPHQKTLAQSQAAIKQQLPNEMYKQALVAFISTWRLRWRARTDCEAGYVVTKCRQFKAAGAAQSENEDPYTLN